MSNFSVYSVLLSLFPCLIPPYAFRLSRVFGTKRVGWVLFTVFTLLALLELTHAWRPALGLDPGLTLDLLNFLVPVLLLIGMIHIENLFKERVRLEEEERRLRQGLEQQVQQRTADLARTNEELQHEILLRKEGEEALRKSKEQYRLLFDENPQPMWIYDLSSFRFLAFNAAALRHYGFTSSEFHALTAKDLVLPEELDAFVNDSTKTSAWVQARGLWHHRKKDATIIEVEITALDLVYSDCPARMVMVNDVTAQRLLQQQLLQSKKSEITAQLAGGVADRFGKLINGIEGDAHVLSKNCQDPAAAEPLKRIATTAGCAAGLTRQLLALVGKHPMLPQSVDLNELLENQSGTLSRLLGTKIALEKICWSNLPPVCGDPALIVQILHNLVLNARDAMPHGGTLSITTTPVRVDDERASRNEEARPGSFICLTVGDTGSGIPPEVQGKLFEPFFTTKTSGNAGLGLATVHGLVKQHSGWIEVDSQPGEGSRFSVYLPTAASMARRAPVETVGA